MFPVIPQYVGIISSLHLQIISNKRIKFYNSAIFYDLFLYFLIAKFEVEKQQE